MIRLTAVAVAFGVCATSCSAASSDIRHADHNAALQQKSWRLGSIVRDGYARRGDAPAVTYRGSGSPCTLHGGQGDGGFQVSAADGGCWLLTPQRRYDLRQWGLSAKDAGPGNAGVLTRVFADTGSHHFVIPAGTFRIACGHTYEAASAISLTGQGAGTSVLKLDPGCHFEKAFIKWQSKSNLTVSGWTLDLNHPRYARLQSVLEFLAYAGDTDRLTVEKMAIINGTTLSFQISVGAWGGFTYANVIIRDNRLEMSPATSQNQCIATTTVNGLGKIPAVLVANNVCIGSAIQVDGERSVISGNDVSNFLFGTGIFLAYDTPLLIRDVHWVDGVATIRFEVTPNAFVKGQRISIQNVAAAGYNGTFSAIAVTPDSVSYALPTYPGLSSHGGLVVSYPSSSKCVISDNVIHDTIQSIDVNGTPPGGIENNCVDSVIKNNRAVNLGGSGFHNYATRARYLNNVAVNVGYNGFGSAAGEGDGAAFLVFQNDTENAYYHSRDLYLEGNVANNKYPQRTRFGYFEEPYHIFNTTFRENDLRGTKANIVVRSLTGTLIDGRPAK